MQTWRSEHEIKRFEGRKRNERDFFLVGIKFMALEIVFFAVCFAFKFKY